MTTAELADVKNQVEELLRLMELDAQVEAEIDESQVIRIQIDGDELGALIGYHGETLSALQTILNLMVNRGREQAGGEGRYRVIVNVGDYRQRQQESLEALARRSAERVRFTRKPLVLPPLSAYDRRIVHLALEKELDIVSESEGEGWERRLVVKLREN